ncbi:NYN domain-containing protein [Acidiferrobacter sp. SPIII_3]|uniref:NYN domain-containing protein n=1 Tax=Acidiferrobacter sp. SPIII_3 TaxID=1281578 RepID=UPI000D732BA6|nr:NYN domain-containing protein [Acidiferrobacter sp. SPIII_3]AWP23824.1 NYN domain-containing protein [Acidiferrobacter sp. SPIII_3]
MRRYAILIDGGFLKKKLGSQRSPLDGVRFDVFLETLKAQSALSTLLLHRIYYYDAPPFEESVDKPLNGGKTNFGTTPLSRQNKALFERLRETPFVSLRLGELAFRGWKLTKQRLSGASGSDITVRAADLRPDIQQKGVDMRIGLDIASLTLKRHVDVIVLVTGDSDFIPAMKFARREGAQLFLVPLGHSIKSGLKEHADLILDKIPLPQLTAPEPTKGSLETNEAGPEPVEPIYPQAVNAGAE